MSGIGNYWAANGQEVTLVTLDSEATDFYSLSPEVTRVTLGLMTPSAHLTDTLRKNLRRLKRLRQEIRDSRPDVVISFMDIPNVLTVLATLYTNIPVIVSQRVNARLNHLGRGREALRRLVYPWASAVVLQTEDTRCWALGFLPKEAVCTIPNPIAPPAYEPDGASNPFHAAHNIIAMGRLNPQKGFDLLIRAFAQCTAKHPDLSLVILGEGEERGRLERLADELGIADRVSMPGVIKEPIKLLSQADLFVLSSRYEGFPNALLEAMSCGLPAVSFDCPSGPGEIIRNGVDGILVPPEDVGALAAAMDRLVSDEVERRQLASRAVEVTERFGVEKVMGMWEALIGKVIEKAHG